VSDGQWIRFVGVEQAREWKTKRWLVVTREGAQLGTVEWWGPWRKYAFNPAPGTGYEQVCLRDIAAFLETETSRHYAQLREKRDGQQMLGVDA
jgi:hypothetical protein